MSLASINAGARGLSQNEREIITMRDHNDTFRLLQAKKCFFVVGFRPAGRNINKK
jgi:hypothetical protein